MLFCNKFLLSFTPPGMGNGKTPRNKFDMHSSSHMHSVTTFAECLDINLNFWGEE